MKSSITSLVTIIVLGAIGWGVFQLKSSPCDTPITYKLGGLDPKFELNQFKAEEDIQNAVDVWGGTWGKPVFLDAPTATITVNFVYDQRSALNSSIDSQKNQLDQKNTSLQSQIDAYETEVTAFEKKLTAFNTQVQQINAVGGASQEEYNSLVAAQKELNSEGEALNARAKQLNLATHNYNAQVQNLNQDVSKFNQAIAQKPEEGLYDPNNDTITIYFADNQQELIHTLTHEFGHALGLNHTGDPKDMMYPYTTTNVVLSDQDKQQLADVCRKQAAPIVWFNQFASWERKEVVFLHG